MAKTTGEAIMRASTAASGASNEIERLRHEFNAFKGPITETTIRQLIAKKERTPCAASRKLKSLNVVVELIGEGILATEVEIYAAKNQHVSLFVLAFCGYQSSSKDGEVCFSV